MATFKLAISGNVTPIELNTLADGTTVVREVNSTIDKILSSSIEKTYGTDNKVNAYVAYATKTTAEALETIVPTDLSFISFIFIKIVSAVSSGTPDVAISVDNDVTYPINLLGIGDFAILPLNGFAPTNIHVKSSGSAARANVEIIIGGSV